MYSLPIFLTLQTRLDLYSCRKEKIFRVNWWSHPADFCLAFLIFSRHIKQEWNYVCAACVFNASDHNVGGGMLFASVAQGHRWWAAAPSLWSFLGLLKGEASSLISKCMPSLLYILTGQMACHSLLWHRRIIAYNATSAVSLFHRRSLLDNRNNTCWGFMLPFTFSTSL